jgi:hypothetical protein
MPLLFRRAGCRISVPSDLFSPGRSRMPRMFRMHARAKPLLCRGNRRVRRLLNRAGCIMSDTLCQNEHTPDPVRGPGSHLDLSLTGIRLGAIIFSQFRSPVARYGLASAPCQCSSPALLDTCSKSCCGHSLRRTSRNLHPQPGLRPEEPSPEQCFCSEMASSPHCWLTGHTSLKLARMKPQAPQTLGCAIDSSKGRRKSSPKGPRVTCLIHYKQVMIQPPRTHRTRGRWVPAPFLTAPSNPPWIGSEGDPVPMQASDHSGVAPTLVDTGGEKSVVGWRICVRSWTSILVPHRATARC